MTEAPLRAEATGDAPVEAWAVSAVATSWLLVGAESVASVVAAVGIVVAVGGGVVGGLARGRRAGLARTVAGILAVAVATTVGVLVRTGPLADTPLAELAERGGTVPAELVVVTEPRVIQDGEGDPGWWTVVRVGRLDGGEERSRALLRGDGDPPPLWAAWRGPVTARPLDRDGFHAHLRALHAVAVVTPVDAGTWAPPGLAGRLTERIRDDVRRSAGVDADDPRALVVGLATGDTRLLSASAQESLRGAGLSHLTAVSGSNVAIVLGAVLVLAAAAGLSPRAEAGILAASIAAFALLTRFEPSVLRASVMALALVVARLRGTLAGGRRALSVGVLALVVADPMLARSLGLLLSAAATWGLLVLQPRLRSRLRRLPDRVAGPLSVALAAQVAVTPLLVVAEGRVRAADVVANVLAVPVAAVASVVGGVGALLAVVRPSLGSPVVGVAAVPAGIVLRVASVVGGRGPTIDATRPLLLTSVICAALWLLARPRGRPARAWATAALCLGVAARLPVGTWALPANALRVTAIDVGQGDAVMVETPDLRLLVDAGSDDRAAAWLRRHRVAEVDVLVASHEHLDHVGGLPQVLDQVAVGQFWHRFLPRDRAAAPGAGPRSIVERLQAEGIVVARPSTGERAVWGATTVEVLGPPLGDRPHAHSDAEANDTSLVLRVQWRGRSVLLTGDVEAGAQRDLLRRPERLRADVLKVPHHGGATSDPAFFRAVGASVAIVSVGRGNDYGHPAPSLLDLLVGATVQRTDLDGTVVVELVPEGVDRGVAGVARSSGWAPAVPVSRPWLSSAHGRHPERAAGRQRRRPPAVARHRGRRRPRRRCPPGRGPPRVRGA